MQRQAKRLAADEKRQARAGRDVRKAVRASSRPGYRSSGLRKMQWREMSRIVPSFSSANWTSA